jgi:hypothetical protein
LKREIYSIDLRKKIIKKDEKMFTHSKERVVRKGKINKSSTPKSCIKVILKDCSMPLPIKY